MTIIIRICGNDKNLIIYGHNRLNQSMFGSLPVILTKDWYNNPENKFINLITEDENVQYEVFSIYKIEEEDYYITTAFRTESDYASFLQVLSRRSCNDFGVNLKDTKQILTLSTCATNNYNYRIVLHAKRVENTTENEQ